MACAALESPFSEPALERNWQAYWERGDEHISAKRFPYADCFRQAAVAHDLPETLLLAVARGESNFDPNARSTADALGLMQIRWPNTARHLGIDRQTQLLEPCTNVDAGARYLKELLERYRGDLHRALAAYNYGPSRIPTGGQSLPKGAVWYSGYIYRHLGYVLQGADRPEGTRGVWRITLFSRPYRAAAFVTSMQPRISGIRLDWFRLPQGGFAVVMLYQSLEELVRGKALLSQWGWPTDP
jgi:hypothetical protein